MNHNTNILLLPFFLTLIILFLVLDSGGGNNLRQISVAFIFLVAIKSFLKKFYKSDLYLLFSIIILFIPSVVKSFLLEVELQNIMIWVLPIIAFPIYIHFCKESSLSVKNFIYAGGIFASIIIILFIGRLTGESYIMILNEYLTSNASGFFNYKENIFGELLPVVYFQGTLNLVFIGILAFGYKYYKIFVIILAALILAPSRFGTTTLIIFILIISALKYFNNDYVRFWMWIILPISIVSITLILFLDWSLIDFIVSIDNVRLGHIESIYQLLKDDPLIILTGSGPGTMFFSYGFNDFTDNIEISHLEILRKYGLGFFVISQVFFGFIIVGLHKIKRDTEAFSLGSHYIVSISNPVLFSIPFLLFLSYCYLLVFKPGLNVKDKSDVKDQ